MTPRTLGLPGRRLRRWMPGLAGLLGLTGTLVAVSGAARAATTPYVVTMPDLQIEVPTDAISLGTNPDTGHPQLQFTHLTWDAGTGPFVITPKYNRRTGTAAFTQTIYKSRRAGTWHKAYKVALAATGIFDAPSDYRLPLTRFTLDQDVGGSPGAVLATSPKSDYCITADFYVGTVANTPNQTYPPQSDCSSPRKALGLAVGWADEYDQTDNGQPIDISNVPDGTYILHAMVDPNHLFVESDKGNDVTDTVVTIDKELGTVQVGAQTGPAQSVPPVTLNAPRAGSTVSGTVALGASLGPSSTAAVTAVQYVLDGEPLGSPVRSAPFTYDWATAAAAPGVHLVSAQVTDAAGTIVTAPARSLTVADIGAPGTSAGDTAPSVTIVNPAPGQIESGTVPVAAVVQDVDPVHFVQFELDGTPLGGPITAPPFATAWDTTTAAAGAHEVSALVADSAGRTVMSTPVAVSVTNPAPPMTCFVLQDKVSAAGRRSVTTPAIHTASAGETLVALVSALGTRQHASVSGAGLSWRLVRRSNAGGNDAEAWTAQVPGVAGQITVTSALSGGAGRQSLTVVALEGVRGVGASSASSGRAGAPGISLRTTDATSLVFAAGASGAASPSLPRGWEHLHSEQAAGSGLWSQYTSQPTGTEGTTVVANGGGSSAGTWNMVAVELLRDPEA